MFFSVCVFVYHCSLDFLNLPVSHTNLFTVVKGELTVPEEALKVNTHTHTYSLTHCYMPAFIILYRSAIYIAVY